MLIYVVSGELAFRGTRVLSCMMRSRCNCDECVDVDMILQELDYPIPVNVAYGKRICMQIVEWWRQLKYDAHCGLLLF
jgi:hypothetical protein